MSNDLCQLAVHFKTDKWGTHRYAQHYQRHLQHLRNDSFNLLEIGIGGYSKAGKGGASLRMWKHFFPAAHVYGMDIRDKSFVDEDRITTFVADQSDPESLRAVAGKIGELDVIIDDGSHLSPHILVTFETSSRCCATAASTPSRTLRRPTGRSGRAASTGKIRRPACRC